MSNFTSASKRTPTQSEPEERRREELCLQLAENLHDLGASEFSQELLAGNGKFLIHVVRCELVN
jgi:hypothetical protein